MAVRSTTMFAPAAWTAASSPSLVVSAARVLSQRRVSTHLGIFNDLTREVVPPSTKRFCGLVGCIARKALYKAVAILVQQETLKLAIAEKDFLEYRLRRSTGGSNDAETTEKLHCVSGSE
jgi:hypothetical protein